MGSAYFINPLSFIITVIIDLYAIAVLLRFLLQWIKADFYNPISQFLVNITSPLLHPMRKLIGSWGYIDMAAIVLFLIVIAVKLSILGLLNNAVVISHYQIPFSGLQFARLPVLCLADGFNTVINLYLFIIFIQVILSWVAPQQYNPAIGIMRRLSAPLLAPARRLLPPLSGFDLSPMVVILLLWVSKMLILPPILKLALIL